MEAPPPPAAAVTSDVPPPNLSSQGQSHTPQPNPPLPPSASSSSGTAVNMGQTLNNPTANVPPSSASASVEQQQQQKMSAAGSATKKRKMMTGGDHHHHQQHFQNSCYFKIRGTVKDLRPAFLEVVHAADFRDCKATFDIRKRMKTILELYKQLRVETAPPAPPERQSSTGEYTQTGMDYQEAGDTKAGPPQQSGIPFKQDDAQRVRESDKEPKLQAQVVDAPEAKVVSGMDTEQQWQGEKGPFVIGGSPIGWNFIVCSSEEPVYYGPTKASWHAKQVANS